jgi:hypothetical protein
LLVLSFFFCVFSLFRFFGKPGSKSGPSQRQTEKLKPRRVSPNDDASFDEPKSMKQRNRSNNPWDHDESMRTVYIVIGVILAVVVGLLVYVALVL